MWRPGFQGDRQAVSDVIGTVLLLGVTVALFGALSVAVMAELQQNPPPENVEFRVDSSGEMLSVTAAWGEALAVQDTRLIYHLNDVRTTRDLSLEPLASNLVHGPLGSFDAWDVGETLRLGCAAAQACAYPGAKVDNITIVQTASNFVLFSTEAGVSRGSLVNPVADLAVAVLGVRDPARPATDPIFFNGASGVFYVQARVANEGVMSTPVAATLSLDFFLDGALFHTDTHTQFLEPGGFYTVETPPVARPIGTFTLRVQVSSSTSFLEAGYGNNQVTQSVSVVAGVADPLAPFEDGNGDLLYNPYVAGDLLLSAADVQDGVHTSLPANGLVIPASVGAIVKSDGHIAFTASRGLSVAVDLRTTGHDQDVRLTAGLGLQIPGARELRAGRTVQLAAGGEIDIRSDRLRADRDDVDVHTTSGAVLAADSHLSLPPTSAPGDRVRVATDSGSVDLQRAILDGTGPVMVSSRGNLFLQGAQLVSGRDVTLNVGVTTALVFVDGVSVVDDDTGVDCADVNPDAIPASNIVGTPLLGQVRRDC